MSSRRHIRGGFTLLEVVVAFTILAVAMTGLIQAFSSGLRGLEAAGVNAALVLHARSKLEEVGISIPLEDGGRDGEFEDGYGWSVSTTALEDAATSDLAAPALPYRVVISITAPDGRTFKLETLRLGVFE